MGNIIVFNMISLDGFFEPQDKELDWHNVDEEFNAFAYQQLNNADALLFGRVTYELMANYWPTPAAMKDHPLIAERMNSMPKVVISTTLDKVEWANTQLLKKNIGDEVKKLKQHYAKDILLFGSAVLVVMLRELDLIDEYRIMVSPILLGSGEPLFKGAHPSRNLTHVKTQTFQSGNVLLTYQPKQS